MNKKTLLASGIMLAFLVGGILAISNQNASPRGAQSPSTKNNEVSYTLADVSQHATQLDCWMAIEGKVYNVTSYIGKHPGGKAILRGCGKDATILFNTRPDGPGTPHPAEARQILQQFYVGDLKT